MARDRFHPNVREALEKDGWTITDDPFFLMVGRRRGFIDLGAEKALLAAERGAEKIAVEIKSFLGTSDLDQFEDALGQFLVYLVALENRDSERVLYLAMPQTFYKRFFDDPFFQQLAKRFDVKLLVVDDQKNSITTWIK